MGAICPKCLRISRAELTALAVGSWSRHLEMAQLTRISVETYRALGARREGWCCTWRRGTELNAENSRARPQIRLRAQSWQNGIAKPDRGPRQRR